jgi:hypothetical protein
MMNNLSKAAEQLGTGMSEHPIANDATIADIVAYLREPAEYVRQVYAHMLECGRQHGSASVRIGVTGRWRATLQTSGSMAAMGSEPMAIGFASRGSA